MTSVITYPALKLSLLPKLETSMRQTRSHRLRVTLLHKMKMEEGLGSSKKRLSMTMGRTKMGRRDTKVQMERRMRKKTLMR